MLKRILVPLDGSGVSASALPHALAVAESFDGQLRLLGVVSAATRDKASITDPVEWRFRRTKALNYFGRIAAVIRAQGFEVDSQLVEGEPAGEIVTAAHNWPADLLVMSAHGSGDSGLSSLGDTTARVMKRVGNSVLIVPAGSPEDTLPRPIRYQKIMVPLDGSPGDDTTLGSVTAFAKADPLEVLLAHVVPVPEMLHSAIPLNAEDLSMREHVTARNRRLAEAHLNRCERLVRRPGLTCRTLLKQSTRIRRTLNDIVEEEAPDLVLMNAHGHGSMGERPIWPYGSVTEHFLAHGQAPMLVHQDECVTAQLRSEGGPTVRRSLNWAPLH